MKYDAAGVLHVNPKDYEYLGGAWYRTDELCEGCDGSGHDIEGMTCDECDGAGHYPWVYGLDPDDHEWVFDDEA